MRGAGISVAGRCRTTGAADRRATGAFGALASATRSLCSEPIAGAAALARGRRTGVDLARGAAGASLLSPTIESALRATDGVRRLTGFASAGGAGAVASADSAAGLRRRVGFGRSDSSMRRV
jgi:hypothetical protein